MAKKGPKQEDGSREKLFCYFMARLGNAWESAIRAGYSKESAWTVAANLLSKPSVRQVIARLSQEEGEQQIRAMAIQGLRRLAFGAVNGAAEWIVSQEEPEADCSLLDLFHVSEIRKPKGGGCEVKFYSRLEALRLLLEYAKNSESNPSSSSFYSALEAAAKRGSAKSGAV